MRKTLLTLLLSATAIVAGCHTKAGKPSEQITALPADCFRTQWTRTLDMKHQTPRDMYISGDSLFIYRSDNVLYRMNRKSGDVMFVSDVAPTGAHVEPPVIQRDTVIIPSDTQLLLLDDRGFRKGMVELGLPIRSGVVGDKTGLFAGIDTRDRGGRIVCIDLDRAGSPYRWELQTEGSVISTPALYQNTLYAGSDDGKVYAIGPDREAVWAISTFQTGRAIRAGIAADASGVYVASLDSKLYVLDPADGKIRWEYFAGTYLIDTPAVTSDLVYLNVKGQGIVALDKKEGDYNRKARWIVADAMEFLAEDAKFAFLRSMNNTILAVDKVTGEIKFRSLRNDLVAFAQNTVDGVVYCATKGGKIIAAVPVTKAGAVGEMVFVEPGEVQAILAAR